MPEKKAINVKPSIRSEIMIKDAPLNPKNDTHTLELSKGFI